MITVNGKEYNTVEDIKGQMRELEALGEQRGSAEDKLLDDLRGLDLRKLEEEEQAKKKPAGSNLTTTESIKEESQEEPKKEEVKKEVKPTAKKTSKKVVTKRK